MNSRDESFVRFEDVPEPALADEEALVAVKSFSLNRGELSLMKNRPAGWRPGQDVAGVIVSGSSLGYSEGEPVVGLVEGAGWAQRVAVGASRLARIPDGVDFAAAATLPIAGVTALRTLRIGGPLFGKRVAITGADGAVGQFAVQIAAISGADVTAIAKAESSRLLEGLGAARVVDSFDAADLTHDVILESIGGASLERAIVRIAPYGTIVSFGNSSGQDARVNLFQFVGHENARIVTSFSYAYPNDGSVAEDLTTLLSMLAKKRIMAPIALRANWKNFAEGAARLRDRTLTGKAVFDVD